MSDDEYPVEPPTDHQELTEEIEEQDGVGGEREELEISEEEEPLYRSPEGFGIFDRDTGLVLSTQRLRESDGPDGILISVDEFQNAAVEIRELVSDD